MPNKKKTDLLKQSSESLAGRIRYLELAPLDAGEVGTERLDTLWLRGGFPDSLLADSDAASLRWRVDFIRTYLERDIPQLGSRIPAETLRRLCCSSAHWPRSSTRPRRPSVGQIEAELGAMAEWNEVGHSEYLGDTATRGKAK